MKHLAHLISRVFLAVALCVSSPAAFAGDSSSDIDKERVAQEIREKAMSGDRGGARWQLVGVEQEHNIRTLGYDWRRLLLDRRDAYEKNPDDLMSIVGISEALHKGADVNQRISFDPSAPFSFDYGSGAWMKVMESNALWIAAKSGDYRMVAVLLEKGADVESETRHLTVVSRYQPMSVLKTKPIFAALDPDNNYDDNEKTMRTLLRYGADTEARDLFGNAPLHYVTKRRWRKMAKILLDAGADVNVKGEIGHTPLHGAAWRNAAEFAKLLIDNDAEINAKDNSGRTPLHQAVQWEAMESAKVLIDNGANVNAKNNEGETPLHWPAYFEKAEVAELLLENGADVNAKNSKGETPLHRAAVVWVMTPRSAKREEEIIMALIRYGADVNAQTTSDTVYGAAGATPLDYATREYWHHDNTIRLLIEHGARCNVRTGELCGEPVVASEPQADYTGLYANAAFAVAGAFAPSWVDAQTFAFNQGDKFVTGQSLSVPLDDFTFAAKRVQVNDLTDYEFAVKWEMEF